jgi:hypothetical protein
MPDKHDWDRVQEISTNLSAQDPADRNDTAWLICELIHAWDHIEFLSMTIRVADSLDIQCLRNALLHARDALGPCSIIDKALRQTEPRKET